MSTCFESMSSQLIVLFMSPPRSLSIQRAFSSPTLSATFSSLPSTSRPHPKMIVWFHMYRASSGVLCSLCASFTVMLTCSSRLGRFGTSSLSFMSGFRVLVLIWHVLTFFSRVFGSIAMLCIRCHAPNWFSAVNMDKDSRRTWWHYCDEWVQNDTCSFSAPGFTKAEEESC